MAKSNKQENKMPKGVFGGELNGANPLEWNLRSTITAQLRHAGYVCKMDAFGDGSGSWIEVYPKDYNEAKKKEGSVKCITIGFDYDGNIMDSIKLFEFPIKLVQQESSKIF